MAVSQTAVCSNGLKGLLAILAMFWFGVRGWVSDVEGICIKHKNNKQLTAYSRTPTIPPLENHDKSVIDKHFIQYDVL
jgi:hypothetical protein